MLRVCRDILNRLRNRSLPVTLKTRTTGKFERLMSKKPTRRTAPASHKRSTASPEALANQAQQDLAAGHFRDAIASFKQLIKVERQADWLAGLAAAYAGRAGELTAKGMLKEALVMWDNRALLDPAITFAPKHAALLLRLNRLDPILDQLAKTDTMDPKTRERLRAMIAARVLVGDSALGDRLPVDDPVRRHAAPARAALSAYCDGDDEALAAALREIPFRSPYRDLAHILRALQRLPDDPAETAKLLGRIGEDSAFAPIKAAAELALLPESTFQQRLFEVDETPARFACVLRGWSHERIALFEELRRLGANPKPDALLRLMHRHRLQFGEDWTRRKSLRLLVRHYPGTLDLLQAVGAAPVSDEEEIFVHAWAMEQDAEARIVSECWEELADKMKLQLEQGSGRELDKLRIALVLRRTDQVLNILRTDRDLSGMTSPVYKRVADQIEDSLSWDPHDRDAYLRLIGYYRNLGQAKDVRRLLDAASARWPNDMQVLQATMGAALDSGAFKKAAGLAHQILAIDPINSGVRDQLVQAHLAHARKQMIKERPDLARKELATASEWVRGEHLCEQLEILSGLNRLNEDQQAGSTALNAIVEQLGAGLTARVALALAGDLVKLSPAKLFKTLGLREAMIPTPADLRAALDRLRRHLDGGSKISGQLNSYLSKAFAKAPWTALTRSEMESACETLRRAQLTSIRQKAARAALKQWSGAPIFKLHAFESKYPHGCRDPYCKDAYDLEHAEERAYDEGDTRTALRIEEVLDAIAPFPVGRTPVVSSSMPPSDDILDSEAEFAQVFVALINTVGLDSAMDTLKLPPDLRLLIKRMEREFGTEYMIESLADFFEIETRHAPSPRRPKSNRKRKPKPGEPHDEDLFEQWD